MYEYLYKQFNAYCGEDLFIHLRTQKKKEEEEEGEGGDGGGEEEEEVKEAEGGVGGRGEDENGLQMHANTINHYGQSFS